MKMPALIRGLSRATAWMALLFLLVGCSSFQTTATETMGPATPSTEPTVTAIPATSRSEAPTRSAPQPTLEETTPTEAISPRALTILYTNDEHGWMEGMEAGVGAANLMGLWREAGYAEDGQYLILSGGDMWTGPAISTWFEGEGMAEVMNEMGYDAAAVGNHEFDFGLEALRARSLESEFPFLSANVRDARDGTTPDAWGIKAYTVIERNGIQVGIIGLTTTLTPVTTNPTNVRDFQFLDYEEALRDVVPQVRAKGAEFLVVAGHLCREELETLAQKVQDLDIQFMGGGHCNELFAETTGETTLVGGGYHMTSFARADFVFDTTGDSVVEASAQTVVNEPGATPDEAVAAVIEKWRARTDEELEVVIGYSERGLRRRSDDMLALVTESWLWAYPTADVSITNSGGFRAELPAGEITFADVVGVLPFNNVLVQVELSGEELLRVLARGDAIVGGARLGIGEWILDETGQPIARDDVYQVLVNDFMYAGGDGFDLLATYDPDAYNTAIDWRQPVIDWILAQESSPEAPLDDAVAALAE